MSTVVNIIERLRMSKLIFIITAIMLIGLLPFTACQTDSGKPHTYLPIEGLQPATGEEAPDDIVSTPGGYAYRANVHQQGVENPWPSIESTEVVLGRGSDALNIMYRDHVETLAGETRNNIIHVLKEGGLFDSRLRLYSVAIPVGIGLTDGGRGVGLPGATGAVLVIEVAPDVASGQYDFEIGIELDGKDYGTIPCRINVSNIADIVIQPAPGSYLSAGGEQSEVILKDVQIKVEVCDRDYHSPWFPSVKKGELYLVVSGHVQNQDREKFEIAMSARGYDEAGEIVAGTLDAAHIAGAIGLHLEYGEIGEFTLHLNMSENISTIWISASGSLITPP